MLIKAGREIHLIKRNESEIRESERQNTENTVESAKTYISIVGAPPEKHTS